MDFFIRQRMLLFFFILLLKFRKYVNKLMPKGITRETLVTLYKKVKFKVLAY